MDVVYAREMGKSLAIDNDMDKKLFDTKVGIVGLGYVGLPLSIAAAENGWSVIGFDKNPNLINDLNLGRSHVVDVQNSQISNLSSSGKLVFTSNLDKLSEVDICIICVPTPLSADHKPDLTYLLSASNSIALVLNSNCIVINESTSFPGTLRDVIQKTVLKKRGFDNDIAGYFAAPERINPGGSGFDYRNIPRVLGGTNILQISRAKQFYESLGTTVHLVSSPEVAEFSKLIENSFRLINISFINELVPYAAKIGVDIFEAINAADTKPFGFMKFLPGPGAGGHCIPVDPVYLVESANKNNVRISLVESAIDINLKITDTIVAKALEIIENTKNPSILLVGVTYKFGINDTRESPSLRILENLIDLNIKVFWLDDEINNWGQVPKYNGENFTLAIALTSATDANIMEIEGKGPILDCTGRFAKILGVISFFKE